MLGYLLFFFIPVGIAISPIKGDHYVRSMTWFMVWMLGILFIGLRFGVGGDWANYLLYMADIDVNRLSLIETLTYSYGNGPGYMALNWLSLKLGLGMIGVNLTCGFIFMTGLIKFCKQQPFPWVALTIAIPYMLYVIAIGYARQGAAIGFFLWALSVLRPGSQHRFLFLVALATLFHFSAVVLFPLVLFTPTPGGLSRWQKLLALLAVLGSLGVVVALGLVEGILIVLNYTAELRRSEGTAFRVYMDVAPVLVSLFFLRRLKSISPDYRLWVVISLVALCCVPLLTFEASTLLDRLALYLTPLQVALWPRLIAVQKTSLARTAWAIGVLTFYTTFCFLWFYYANTAAGWLPYQMWPLVDKVEFYIY